MAVAVDFGRHFLPEPLTPLFHTAAYATLSVDERRRYNQLYALYFNEQIVFFETALAESVLGALAGSGLPGDLADDLRQFIEEEARHSRMFCALNAACAPALYAGGSRFHFIRIHPSQARALDWVARRPRAFPMVLWLMLLQEERSMFYSRAILDAQADLESHFVGAHRAHLADETGHVGWDEALLDRIWDRCHPLLRKVNAELFRWLVGEFFNTPKRGGVAVLTQLALDCPAVAPRLGALRAELRALGGSPAYHRSLYSRDMVPRTFARFDRCPEFSSLGRTLYGYDRLASPLSHAGKA